MAVPVLFATAGNFSDAWSRRFSAFIAFFLRILYIPGMKLIRENLKVAFPELSPNEVSSIAGKNIFHTVWNWVDFIRILKNPHGLERFLNADQDEILKKLPSQIIFCLPHLGSWELLAQLAPRWLPDCVAVAEFFPYPKLNQLLSNSRTIQGLKIIPRDGAVRGVLAAGKNGASIGILIDQNLSPRHGGIFVDFFGLPATASPLPAIIAQRQNIPLFSGACVRMNSGKFRIIATPIPCQNNDDRQIVTQAIIKANEDIIRQYPEQYTWLYKKWVCIPSDVNPDLIQKFPKYAVHKKYPINPK